VGSNNQIAHPILFFDGVCNLCNSSVQFIIKRDKSNRFRFSSLQSSKSKELLPTDLVNTENLQTLVLLKDDKILTKSTAALNIARGLSGLWPILYIFMIIPKFLRDLAYDFIAKNRYKWFGKKDACMIPSPELKAKFID